MTALENVAIIEREYGEGSEVAQLARALGVLLCTPSTRRHLEATDVTAIMQGERALERAAEHKKQFHPHEGILKMKEDD